MEVHFIRVKWDIDKARQLFKDKELILDETNYINCNTRMKCHDKNGYYYYTTIDNLQTNKQPQKFHQQNPYTLFNLKNYIKENNCNSEIISTEYIGSKSKIKLKCECGTIFETASSELIQGKQDCKYCA